MYEESLTIACDVCDSLFSVGKDVLESEELSTFATYLKEIQRMTFVVKHVPIT